MSSFFNDDDEKYGHNSYTEQLDALDKELKFICSKFHEIGNSNAALRKQQLQALAAQKQTSLNQILNEILDDKKRHHPYLHDQVKEVDRAAELKVPVLDQTAEGLMSAARVANKPFKKTIQALAKDIFWRPEKVLVGPVKGLEGIQRKLADSPSLTIFDLNRATLVFADLKELLVVLRAIVKHFEKVVYSTNKFKSQWEHATQPPCFHFNVLLKRNTYPLSMLALLVPDSFWVVELQVTMQDFLDVKERCHPIYELLRLPKNIDLPRACPVCSLFQTFVQPAEITERKDIVMGQKFLKQGKWSGQVVAYNLIALDAQSAVSKLDIFIREVRIFTKLQHKNILKILGVVKSNELGFLTEWISGGDLSSCLERLDSELEWEVALQVCEGLIYLHNHDVVHYDLKSANILCSFNPLVVKICDFGLSHNRASTMPAGVSVGGTANWRAPETWVELDKHNAAADVYSFGCLLIEIFSSVHDKKHLRPWGDTPAAEIRQHVLAKQKPPELYYVSNLRLRKLAEACLAFDPAMRPSSQKVYNKLLGVRNQIQMYIWWTSLEEQRRVNISRSFSLPMRDFQLTEEQFRWVAGFLAKQPLVASSSETPSVELHSVLRVDDYRRCQAHVQQIKRAICTEFEQKAPDLSKLKVLAMEGSPILHKWFQLEFTIVQAELSFLRDLESNNNSSAFQDPINASAQGFHEAGNAAQRSFEAAIKRLRILAGLSIADENLGFVKCRGPFLVFADYMMASFTRSLRLVCYGRN